MGCEGRMGARMGDWGEGFRAVLVGRGGDGMGGDGMGWDWIGYRCCWGCRSWIEILVQLSIFECLFLRSMD